MIKTSNSSPPCAAYMLQWIGSALVQVMACRLFGAKSTPEPMLAYCKLDLEEQTSMNFESKYKTFYSWKCIWKCRLRNGGHFVQGRSFRWVLNLSLVSLTAWCRAGDKPLYFNQWWPQLIGSFIWVTKLRWLKSLKSLGAWYSHLLGFEGMKCVLCLSMDKMAAISQMIFSDAFSWMKNFVFWLKFYWCLFLRVQLTIVQHWFR